MLMAWAEAAQPYLVLIATVSGVLALVSLVLVPVLIMQMPGDYFLAAHRIRRRGSSARWLTVARNLLAITLFVAGLMMLVLPGQGLLTLLAALIMSDVPGKYRIERWLILRPGVLTAINWVRRRYRKTPIMSPPQGLNRSRLGRRQDRSNT